MSGTESVPAILEENATGEIAALYDDIRATLGGGIVNLIWRHVATMPGALPWAWQAVRPLYLGPGLAHAAALRGAIVLPRVPAFSRDALAAAGVDDAGLAQIDAVLDSYNHTNALAVVVLSALLSFYDPQPGTPAASPAALAPPAPRAPDGAMPVLLPLSAMRPEIARLIEELNGFGEDAEPGVVATMYRHLAHWPGYLALIRTALAPPESEGALRAMVREVRALGRAHGQAMAPLIAPGEPPETAARALAAFRRFAEHPIARMAGIAAIIREITPRAEGQGRA
jgi:hypothetical protein